MISDRLPFTLRISDTLNFDELYNYFVAELLRLDEIFMHSMKDQIIVRLLVRVSKKLDSK